MFTSMKKYWLCTIVVLTLIWCITANQEKISVRSVTVNCSRYEFHFTRRMWTKSEEDCKSKKGTLVCIESRDEWEFIRDEIKNIRNAQKIAGKIEWNIGLKKENDKWKWSNGKDMKWTTVGQWPWHNGEPRKDEPNGNCTKIWTSSNLRSRYDNVECTSKSFYICEYKRSTEDCKESEKASSSGAPETTTRMSSTPITESPTKTKTQRQRTTKGDRSTKETVFSVVAQTALASTTGIALTTKTTKRSPSRLDLKNTRAEKIPHSSLASKTVNPTEKQESVRDTKPQEKGFQITYLAIALAVILVLLVCVLLTLYCCKIRKKDKNHDSKDGAIRSPVSVDSTTVTEIKEITKGNSFVAFKMVHDNLADSRMTNEFETFSVKTSSKKSGAGSESSKDSSQTNISMNETEAPSSSPPEDDKKEEVVYATVNKAAKVKKGNQESQITYADLASFNNNKETVINMPPPYQPVEYAEIIGKKTSKKK